MKLNIPASGRDDAVQTWYRLHSNWNETEYCCKYIYIPTVDECSSLFPMCRCSAARTSRLSFHIGIADLNTIIIINSFNNCPTPTDFFVYMNTAIERTCRNYLTKFRMCPYYLPNRATVCLEKSNIQSSLSLLFIQKTFKISVFLWWYFDEI